MASSYPGTLDSFSAHTDQVDIVAAADVNELQEAIVATQTELGTDVAGSAATLKARLVQSMAADGDVVFATATRLAISSAAITITQNWHTVDGEGDTDDILSTISGGAEGFVLFIRPDDDAATITIDTAGNILLPGGLSLVLDDEEDMAILIYDAGLSKWCVVPTYDPTQALTYINEQNTRHLQFTCVDYATDCAVADGQAYFHVPPDLNGYNIVYVHGEVITAGTTGVQTMQLANVTQTADVLSTLMTIDTGETGSDTAATPAVINTSEDDLQTNDVLRIDIDVVHTTAAKGLIFTIGVQKP